MSKPEIVLQDIFHEMTTAKKTVIFSASVSLEGLRFRFKYQSCRQSGPLIFFQTCKFVKFARAKLNTFTLMSDSAKNFHMFRFFNNHKKVAPMIF